MCRWKRIGKYKKGSRSLGFKGSREKRGIEAHLGYWSDGEMLVVYNSPVLHLPNTPEN